MEYITNSYEETVAFAEQFAKTLHGGEVIAFTGGLGAGKTAFCTGIARGLGYSGAVSSPTFGIVNIYNGDIVFAHFDAYRINSDDDMDIAGFYDYLDMGAVIAVEWSELVMEYLPENTIDITIETLQENKRKITIKGAMGF